MYFPLADLNLVTAVEDGNKDNQLVGIAITIPSLSRALQKCRRGRLLPFGWWYLLRAIKWHKTEAVDLLLIGVLPEYRAKGANALVFADLIPRYVKYGFKWGRRRWRWRATAAYRASGARWTPSTIRNAGVTERACRVTGVEQWLLTVRGRRFQQLWDKGGNTFS